MIEKIICIEGVTCPRSAPNGMHRIPVDIEVAMGKRRAATPHMWELEAVVRRGF